MKTLSLSSWILLSLVVGLFFGTMLSINSPAAAQTLSTWINPIGSIWINAIRMSVIPLLVALLITAIASQEGKQSTAALGLKTIGLFSAFITGSSLYTFLFAPPLINLLRVAPEASKTLLANTSTSGSTTGSLPPFSDWLIGLVPANPIAAASNGELLPLLVFVGLFATALTKISDPSRDSVVTFFAGIRDAMLVLIAWVMKLAPFGIFGIVFPLAATLGVDAITALGSFILIASGLITVAIVLLVFLVQLLTPVSASSFLKAVAPAQIIGFSTRSSVAALPATFSAARHLGVKDTVSGVVLPIAVTLFKFASPIARTSGSYFIAALYGIELGPLQLLTIAAAIGLFSFYSPGIPSGGLLIMAPVYESLGLPVEGIGILIAIDLIVDMFITAANVTANTASTLILSHYFAVTDSSLN